ncbi:MAG TPA: cytochrome c biogenesis protein CcdA [Bacteroidales bacterium]|nr:cytochrome c biogenesis protein CcdA [Bacteroidales bacterium]
MKGFENRITALALFVAFWLPSSAQILEPVKWSFSADRIDEQSALIVFTATIDEGWFLYGKNIPEGGPVPTTFNFNASNDFDLAEMIVDPQPFRKFDQIFKMELELFENKAKFTQKIRMLTPNATVASGYLEFMCCNATSCLPPTPIDFSINIPAFRKPVGGVAEAPVKEPVELKPVTVDVAEPVSLSEPDLQQIATEETDVQGVGSDERGGLWGIFLVGIIGGLLALLTPCVFPMIPMTVSYFLRNTSDKAKGRRHATFYGLSIVIIYVVLGLGISMAFGSDGLNRIATNPWFNLFFFALLVLFAAAFFGAFELTLPSKWTTALDNKADKTGGLLGVFLMALTMVLVSFSCTGPIVGTLLVQAAVTGNMLSPAIGMTGFALAFAIPFALLAFFPSWLAGIPKSGGWLNTVKVVLAFLLLAFSLKFLSVADAVAQWNLLSRDLFLAIWISVFALLGFYLLGKLKFQHDSPQSYISVPRLLLALISFAFAVYLVPGLWGAPLKAISSFAPSITAQEFNIVDRQDPSVNLSSVLHTVPSGYKTKIGVHGLTKFLDYDQGLAFAGKVNKPVFLDFTGFGCANCRKMEAVVWSDPAVLQRLRNDFVIVSLYVDDRTPLSEEEQFISTFGGRERRIRNVGHKWSDFQARQFGVNAQPYYVLLAPDGACLAEPYSFNTSIPQFIAFLDSGLQTFRNR